MDTARGEVGQAGYGHCPKTSSFALICSTNSYLYPLPTIVLFATIHGVFISSLCPLLGRIQANERGFTDASTNAGVILIYLAQLKAPSQEFTRPIAKNRSECGGVRDGWRWLV
jgi:hypothetical protein